MTISSDYTYDLSADAIITEAAQRVGICAPDGSPSANQMASLRTSLNLYIKALAIRGVIITATEAYQTTLTSGTASYTYPADTVDVLPEELFIRQVNGAVNSDVKVLNMARAEYDLLNNKDVQGRPTRALITRSTSNITVTLWPVPDDSSTYFISTRVRFLRNMSTGANTADLPQKYGELLVLAAAKAAAQKFGTSLEQAVYWGTELEKHEVFALADSTERGNLVLKAMPSLRIGRRN